MIMAFYTPLCRFDVLLDIPKGIQASAAHMVGLDQVVITAPITLKPSDGLLVDIRNGKVEEVERAGIVIWRATCMN